MSNWLALTLSRHVRFYIALGCGLLAFGVGRMADLPVALLAFGLFTQVDVMTNGGPVDSTSTVVFHAVRTGFREQDIGYGSTVALVFFGVVLAVSAIQRVLVAKGAKQ